MNPLLAYCTCLCPTSYKNGSDLSPSIIPHTTVSITCQYNGITVLSRVRYLDEFECLIFELCGFLPIDSFIFILDYPWEESLTGRHILEDVTRKKEWDCIINTQFSLVYIGSECKKYIEFFTPCLLH